MRITGVTYGKLKTPLKVNGNLNVAILSGVDNICLLMICDAKIFLLILFWLYSVGGGGVFPLLRKVPAANNSKTISDNELKSGGVVKNHKLINIGVVYLAFNVIITS